MKSALQCIGEKIVQAPPAPPCWCWPSCVTHTRKIPSLHFTLKRLLNFTFTACIVFPNVYAHCKVRLSPVLGCFWRFDVARKVASQASPRLTSRMRKPDSAASQQRFPEWRKDFLRRLRTSSARLASWRLFRALRRLIRNQLPKYQHQGWPCSKVSLKNTLPIWLLNE